MNKRRHQPCQAGRHQGHQPPTKRIVQQVSPRINTQTLACDSKKDVATINWWKQELNLSDLNIDNPYNTRKNVGLPPRPISSVSLSAIKAVVNYVESDYYFYINDKTGKTEIVYEPKDKKGTRKTTTV